jgi:sugar lactone lactonase YvrE
LKTFKIITLLFITILSSCVKEDTDDTEIIVEPVKPSNLAISSISPNFGPKNTTVTITGVDFSQNITSNKVTINGLECNIISASDKVLNVTIPRGATTGNITVTVGGNTQQGPVFTYQVTPSVVTTVAGNGIGGYLDGLGTNSQFYNLQGIAVDTDGNLYIGDSSNYRIRKITSQGTVSTLAGSGTYGYIDGSGTDAQFKYVVGVAVDTKGNVYVADYENHRIRKVTPSGDVTTFAGSGEGFADGDRLLDAKFKNPNMLAVDADGNVYVSDSGNFRIRKIDTAGKVSTLAGSGEQGYLDGIGTVAKFGAPIGIAADNKGFVYVCDRGADKIRKISPNGIVTTLAGSSTGFSDGIGSQAIFNNPRGVAVDSNGNVYVADTENHRIRKITPSGLVTTLAGSGKADFVDGIGSEAKFNFPIGIAVDKNDNIYVDDHFNQRVRKITQD